MKQSEKPAVNTESTKKTVPCMVRKMWAELPGCVAEIGEVKNYFTFWRRESRYRGMWWWKASRKKRWIWEPAEESRHVEQGTWVFFSSLCVSNAFSVCLFLISDCLFGACWPVSVIQEAEVWTRWEPFRFYYLHFLSVSGGSSITYCKDKASWVS